MIYFATITVAVDADSQGEAEDAIHEALPCFTNSRSWFFDWQYMQFGPQWLHSTQGQLHRDPMWDENEVFERS